MTFEEATKDIYLELHKVSQAKRFWRAINSTFVSAPCAHQQYLFFFDWIKHNFIFLIIVRLYALTHDVDRDGMTIGKWLKEGAKSPNVKKDELRIAKKAYAAMLSKPSYSTLEKMRHAIYAHNLINKKEMGNLPNQAYKDLFSLVVDLQNIYDLAAKSGICDGTVWEKPMDAQIELSVIDMMKVLEEGRHKEEVHQRISDLDKKRKADNPELYT